MDTNTLLIFVPISLSALVLVVISNERWAAVSSIASA
jgi:hypothetical protein